MDQTKKSYFSTILILTIGGIMILLFMSLSIIYGAANIPFSDVVDSFFRFDSQNLNHQIIAELRVPRTIADVAIGAAFATAGAIMQGMTKNPLADSGLLGINAGSSFALSLCFAFGIANSYSVIVLFSFLGAAISTIIVYGVTGFNHGKTSPVRLVLAGSAVGMFLLALSQAIAMHFNVGREITFWTSGGVAGITMNQIKVILPIILIALIGAICLSRSITILSLGEDVANGLGINISKTKTLCMIVVLVLAGSSVALAGSISYVGLIIPHIVRRMVGQDYRRIIPCTIVVGSLFMLIADVISRVINPPHETPIGLVFAIIGVPFFIYILRKDRRNLGG